MSIQLRWDAETGKRDIVVKLTEDPDATPVEHEQLHRKLVDRLIEGGLLKSGEAGRLIVEREMATPTDASRSETPEQSGQRIGSGQ